MSSSELKKQGTTFVGVFIRWLRLLQQSSLGAMTPGRAILAIVYTE
ncbi:hypothetical protein AB9K34_23940 [Sedimentitalea sp. XS_ASV28]